MPVIGTAGHVDHGKSTIVLALTGRDPDRWEEEKRRGLTIDLGFAWMTLPSGEEASFVDVPGHERFIKNMLAGIEAIDIALLVVAADEGWMPQSEEHLAVLDLLDVHRGIVALTKVDKVDEDLTELVTLEIGERLAGTTLDHAKVIPVSAITGEGMDNLRIALAEAAAALDPVADGSARLWIDRSFTITGAGTVVTGTLLDGPLGTGEEVQIWPPGAAARIRGLQSHEREVAVVPPRRRVAVNLAGWDRHLINRGAMLGRNGQFVPTKGFLASYRSARYAEPISAKGAFHLHLGSGAWPVKLSVVEHTNDETYLHVALPSPLCLQVGDGFILREVGKRSVIGGGKVIDPAPPAARKHWLPAVARLAGIVDADPDERAARLLDIRGSESTTVLAAHTGGGVSPRGVPAGDVILSEERSEALMHAMGVKLAGFHQANPLRPGMPAAAMSAELGQPPPVVLALANLNPVIRERSGLLSLADFEVRDVDADWRRLESMLNEHGLAVPKIGDLDIPMDLLHTWLSDGKLVRVSADFAFLAEQIGVIAEAIRSFPSTFTVSEFKDVLGISRKHAVPLLEWADANHHTIRSGDNRRARR